VSLNRSVRWVRQNGLDEQWRRVRGGQTRRHLLYADSPVDAQRAAAFYRDVFGWKVDTEREDPSFEDGTGHVIGHIHADMEVSGEAGIRPYVHVESVETTLERIEANGGGVITAPYPEGNLTVAVFRDPEGNIVGVWQLS
jgi:uncharacterized protein